MSSVTTVHLPFALGAMSHLVLSKAAVLMTILILDMSGVTADILPPALEAM